MTSATAITEALAGAIEEHLEAAGGASCDAIAAKFHRRRADVLATLRADERFVHRGRGRWSTWHIASQIEGDGDGTDWIASNGANLGNGTSRASDAGERVLWSWERAESRCTDPVVHRGFNMTYESEGKRWCVRCDEAPIAPPLTFDQWFRGEGGEEPRAQFENDYRDLVAFGRATPEQVERMRFAFTDTTTVDEAERLQ